MKVLIIITIIGFLITIFNIYLDSYITKRCNSKQDFSIRETMSAYNVPIVSFRNNGQNINFIIDTGATDSVLNKDTLNKFDYIDIKNSKCSSDGIGGKLQGSLATMDITKDGRCYHSIFNVMSIPAFQAFADEGIEIHGLLGNKFLRHYQLKIDYTDYKVNLH